MNNDFKEWRVQNARKCRKCAKNARESKTKQTTKTNFQKANMKISLSNLFNSLKSVCKNESKRWKMRGHPWWKMKKQAHNLKLNI